MEIMLPEENFREINGNTKQVNVYNYFWKGMECMDNFGILNFILCIYFTAKVKNTLMQNCLKVIFPDC